jgi:hypothetical protein
MPRPDFIQAPVMTPSELVTAIRANDGNAFNLTHSEAEQLARLFASVASVTAERDLLSQWRDMELSDLPIGASA